MVLHYALECFEGMKAYKDAKGNIRLFRPDCNIERLNNSLKRLHLPQIDAIQFVKVLTIVFSSEPVIGRNLIFFV